MFQGVFFGSSAFGLAALVCAGASAQAPLTPPPEVRQQGEQQERRQQEREGAQRGLLQPEPKAPPPRTPDPIEPWPTDEPSCLPIRNVVLVGDASDAFVWALDGLRSGSDAAIGRCLGVQGVNIAAGRAQHALLQRGYVTSRILFQPQDLSGGTLTLTLPPTCRPATCSGCCAR